MTMLIKQGKVISDLWFKIASLEDILDHNMNYSILPLSVLTENYTDFLSQGSVTNKWSNKHQLDTKLLGLWFTADLQPENLKEALRQQLLTFSLLNIEIQDFNDGRVFSLVRLLRTRYEFKGELRVSGKYLIDQMAMLKACGVTSFSMPEGSDYEHALFILSNTPENTF